MHAPTRSLTRRALERKVCDERHHKHGLRSIRVIQAPLGGLRAESGVCLPTHAEAHNQQTQQGQSYNLSERFMQFSEIVNRERGRHHNPSASTRRARTQTLVASNNVNRKMSTKMNSIAYAHCSHHQFHDRTWLNFCNWCEHDNSMYIHQRVLMSPYRLSALVNINTTTPKAQCTTV